MSISSAVEDLAELEWLERVVLDKARRRFSIMRDEGFLRALLREARRLRSIVTIVLGSDRFAAELARSTRIDWRGATAREREHATLELVKLLRGLPSAFLPEVEVALLEEGRHVVREARRETAREHPKLKIKPTLSLPNERAVRALATSSSVFVSRAYERRAPGLGKRVRELVSRYLERGLGRSEIGARLEREFKNVAVMDGYWETVAAVHVSRARSYAALATYAESGVEEFEWVSILDTRTTEICKQLAGTVFSIKKALDGFERLEGARSLEAVKRLSPFLRESDAGFVLPDGSTVRKLGTKTGKGSIAALQAAGIHSPPVHFR